jgi:anti-sigma28 factor (negative regulator of flagellin synthesis)
MNDQTLRKIDSATPKAEALEGETQVKQSRRPRTATTLKLQWLAERARKVRRIKEQVEAGTYHVDSHAVSRAVLGIYEDEAE